MTLQTQRVAGPAGIELWLVDLGRDGDDETGRLETLDAAERARAARFLVDHARRRFVAAHHALRALLAARTGTPAAALRFSIGPFGKPALDPPSCAFNLSHSDDVALVAIADTGEIGVDVECARTFRDLPQLAGGVLTAREFAALQDLPAAAREAAFLRAWTRKEACMKAPGLGLQLDPRAFEVGIGPDPGGGMQMREVEVEHAGRNLRIAFAGVTMPRKLPAAVAYVLGDP